MVSQSLSPRIIFGANALDELENLKTARAAIVADQCMHDLGFVAKVQENVARANGSPWVVGCVYREPYVEDVEPLVDGLREFKPDTIIALGGGSVMDAAKTAWAFYQDPTLDWQRAFTVNGVGASNGRAQFVAIPTTSGSGSEVSRVAVLIDGSTHLKRLVMSPHLTPQVAVLDPELALTMPRALTAHSAFDALTHAIEALVTRATNEFARANALYAITLIFEHLPNSYSDAERVAREKIQFAATMASMAVSNSMAGLVHGMDQVGPLFHLPHGLVCAILLPYTIAFHLDSARAEYSAMGRAIGAQRQDAGDCAREFLRRVIALARTVNIPSSFQEAGLAENEYFGAMETLVDATLESRSTQLSPRVPSALEARELFERAYWGQLSA